MLPSPAKSSPGSTCARLLLAIGLWALKPSTVSGAETNTSTIVLIHGAFGGGWDWKAVGDFLARQGHVVYRPTLTGLGERSHLATPEIGLRTHVQDIVNVLRYESLTNVVLCAHSYGGMVATGVMDQVPERLRRVVFLDAVMPDDGESFFTFHEAMDARGDAKPDHGYWTFDGAFSFDKTPPAEVPQAFKTFTDVVSFKNPIAKALPGTLVVFLEGDERPEEIKPVDETSRFRSNVLKRATARGWKVRKFRGDHVSERSRPLELAAFLDTLVR